MLSIDNEIELVRRANDVFYPVMIPTSEDDALDILDRVFNDPLFDSVVLTNNEIHVYWSNVNNESLVYEVCSFVSIGAPSEPIEYLYNLACTNPSLLIMVVIRDEVLGVGVCR